MKDRLRFAHLPIYAITLCLLSACQPASDLPFTSASPIIYDNDSELEGLDLPYALALNSSGEIRLAAVTYLLAHDYHEFMQIAARSGLRNLTPVPTIEENGTPVDLTSVSGLVLKRPESGRIEDTVPMDGASIRTIIREARNATPETPLIIATGGPLTNIASAWLLAPDIADRVIVSSIISAGANGWNDNADAWAKYIVMERLRSVVFSTGLRNTGERKPNLTEAQLRQAMPDSELRRYMIDRIRGGNSQAIDIASLMVVVRPDLVLRTRRYSFSHWEPGKPWWPDSHPEVPVYREDRSGYVTVITGIAPLDAFEAEYWRALSNPLAYDSDRITQQAPYQDQPLELPGTLQAELFDNGGIGEAYHSDRVVSFADAQRPPWFRPHQRIHLETMNDESRDMYIRVHKGDWLEYTVENMQPGDYRVSLHGRTETESARVMLGLDDGSELTTFELSGNANDADWHTISEHIRNFPPGSSIIRISILSGSVDLDRLHFTPLAP